MPELSRAKSAQLLGTGVLLVLLSSALFGLLYLIHGKNYEIGESNIFDRKAAFWIAIPIIVSGLVGALAGITKKNVLVILYMFGALVSTCLAGLAAIGYGLKVTTMRAGCGEDSSCKNSDPVVLIGTIVLIASLVLSVSIWAAVKACQAKWGPSKKTPSTVRIARVQYTVQANGQPPTTTAPEANNATTTTPEANNATNGHTCHSCGGHVNVAAATELPDSSTYDQNNQQTPGYESLLPVNKTSTEYEKLQPPSTAKDDGSPEKSSEIHDLNTTTSTHTDYEAIDDDVRGNEQVNEGFDSNECSTAL